MESFAAAPINLKGFGERFSAIELSCWAGDGNDAFGEFAEEVRSASNVCVPLSTRYSL